MLYDRNISNPDWTNFVCGGAKIRRSIFKRYRIRKRCDKGSINIRNVVLYQENEWRQTNSQINLRWTFVRRAKPNYICHFE